MRGALRRAAASVVPTPGYHGWTVAGVALACSALTAPGQSFLVSLYLEHFAADLGLSRVQLASLYSAATLLAAAALPLAGRLADRMPSRRFLGGTLLLLAVVFLHMAAVRGPLTLGIGFVALRFLAQGAIGLGTLTTVVRWFRRYRGRALALVSLGYSVGEMTFPSLVLALVATLGWRGSWVALAAAYALVLAPIAFRLLRERDPAVEPIDGVPTPPPVPGAPPAPAEREITLRQAIRRPVFWALLLVVAVSPLVATGVIFHQVGFFASRGWASALVAPAFMCYAAGGIVATYATGLALERVPSRFGVAAALLVLALALGAAWLPLPEAAGAVVYGTMLGLASGAIATGNAVIWPDYFGVAALGSIKGVVNAVRNGATAVGPPLVALLLTADGSYARAIAVLAGLAALGAVGALACRPPRDAAPAP